MTAAELVAIFVVSAAVSAGFTLLLAVIEMTGGWRWPRLPRFKPPEWWTVYQIRKQLRRKR